MSSALYTDIEAGIAFAEKDFPAIIGMISTFYPPIAAVTPFLPLLAVAMQAVQAVQQATGASGPTAVAAVSDHLTAGQPNASALAPSASP